MKHLEQIAILHYATSIADIRITKDELSLIVRLNDLVLNKGTRIDFKTICDEKKIQIFNVCNHRWVRTTKNYKPAKKCVECGLIELK